MVRLSGFLRPIFKYEENVMGRKDISDTETTRTKELKCESMLGETP